MNDLYNKCPVYGVGLAGKLSGGMRRSYSSDDQIGQKLPNPDRDGSHSIWLLIEIRSPGPLVSITMSMHPALATSSPPCFANRTDAHADEIHHSLTLKRLSRKCKDNVNTIKCHEPVLDLKFSPA